MPAIGIVVVWFGWSASLWGYCLIKGYNVKFTDLVNPVHFYSGKWPPPRTIPPESVLPDGRSSEPVGNVGKEALAGVNQALTDLNKK